MIIFVREQVREEVRENLDLPLLASKPLMENVITRVDTNSIITIHRGIQSW